MPLDDLQERQIARQLAAHQHDRYETAIQLPPAGQINGFLVLPGVFRPEVTSSMILAQFLFFNCQFYHGKHVWDMGTGTGIHGIIMGLMGARSIRFSDISEVAMQNAKENAYHFFGRANHCHCRVAWSYAFDVWSQPAGSDLFASMDATSGLRHRWMTQNGLCQRPVCAPSKTDLIVFNHPFFGAEPIAGQPVSRSMLDNGQLIRRFLREIPQRFGRNIRLIVPFLDLAGQMNNPYLIVTEEFAEIYNIDVIFYCDAQTELQQGFYSIYEIWRK